MPDDFEYKVSTDGVITVDGTVVEEVVESDILDELPEVDDFARIQAKPESPEVAAMRDKLERLEPFEEFLAQIGRGELTVAPAAPPAPTPEDAAGYFVRVSSPRGDAIRRQVQVYAESLPEQERLALDSDFAKFNAVFDKIAAVSAPPPASSVKVGPAPQDIERILRSREARKDAARSLPAGTVFGSESFGPPVDRSTSEVEAAKRAIARNPNSTEAGALLARALGLA